MYSLQTAQNQQDYCGAGCIEPTESSIKRFCEANDYGIVWVLELMMLAPNSMFILTEEHFKNRSEANHQIYQATQVFPCMTGCDIARIQE